MKKIAKQMMRLMGGKPNGTDETSCVNDVQHIRQVIGLLATAFIAGGLIMGYKGIPEKVRIVEDKVLIIEQKLTVLEQIDARLARIENALIKR